MANRPYRIRFVFDDGSGICLGAGKVLTRERFGSPIELQQLGRSPVATAKVAHVLAWYDQSLDWEHPPEAIPWSQGECDRFHAAVLQVLAAIRRDLGGEYELVNEQPVM